MARKTSSSRRGRLPSAPGARTLGATPPAIRVALGALFICTYCPSTRPRYIASASRCERAAGRVAHTNSWQRCTKPAACNRMTAPAAATSPPISSPNSHTDHGPGSSDSSSSDNTSRSTTSSARPTFTPAGRLPPFRATAPGQFALSPGPISCCIGHATHSPGTTPAIRANLARAGSCDEWSVSFARLS